MCFYVKYLTGNCGISCGLQWIAVDRLSYIDGKRANIFTCFFALMAQHGDKIKYCRYF